MGDIYQTDHGILPTVASARRHLRRARARVAALTERFRRPKYHYVFGNHDEIAADVGAVESVTLQEDSCCIVFIHGHQFDPVALQARLAADMGTWAMGRLRASGLRPAARWFEERDIAIKDRRFRGPAGPYAVGAARLAAERHASVVVMGHTHCARIDRVGGILSVNTGSCSRGAITYVSLDTAQRRLRVVEGTREQVAEFV